MSLMGIGCDGGWWIIYHLSAPPNHSINDFINPGDFPCHIVP